MYTHAHVHAQALELLGLPEFVDVFDSSLADIMPTDAAAQQDWCVHYEYSYASHAAAITNCEVCAAHILTCIAGTLARCPPPLFLLWIAGPAAATAWVWDPHAAGGCTGRPYLVHASCTSAALSLGACAHIMCHTVR